MRKLVLVCAQLLLSVGSITAWGASPTSAPYCGQVDFSDQERAEQQEALCLRTLTRSVSRSGNLLRVKLHNGTFKTYRSNPAACNKDDAEHCVQYWLVGYHEAARLYIVLVGGYDDFDCRFVSALDGTEPKIGGHAPHFAPDESTFIVISDEDGFAIGSVASNPPSLRLMDWGRESNDGQFWEFQGWLDNDHVALRFSGQSIRICPDGNCEAVLVHVGNSWSLQRKS
jgi:hypothetical protein